MERKTIPDTVGLAENDPSAVIWLWLFRPHVIVVLVGNMASPTKYFAKIVYWLWKPMTSTELRFTKHFFFLIPLFLFVLALLLSPKTFFFFYSSSSLLLNFLSLLLSPYSPYSLNARYRRRKTHVPPAGPKTFHIIEVVENPRRSCSEVYLYFSVCNATVWY